MQSKFVVVGIVSDKKEASKVNNISKINIKDRYKILRSKKAKRI